MAEGSSQPINQPNSQHDASRYMIVSTNSLLEEEGAVTAEAADAVAMVTTLPPPPAPPLSPPPTPRMPPRQADVAASSDDEKSGDDDASESSFLGEGHDAELSSSSVAAIPRETIVDRIFCSEDNDKNNNLANTECLSRREQIRAKLRQSEQRLLSFTSRECGDPNGESIVGGGCSGFAAAVAADLKKIEEEKNALALQLQALQQKTTMEDGFLREKLEVIQSGFRKQVETIQGLEQELSTKDDEIASLRNDLIQTLRLIVELEFDLEARATHSTNHVMEQFQWSEDALREMKRQHHSAADEDATDHTNTTTCTDTTDGGGASLQTTCSTHNHHHHDCTESTQHEAQTLIGRLLDDLNALEGRYKADQLDAASELYRAEMTIKQLRIQVQVLEQQQKQQQQQLKGDARQQQKEGVGGIDWLCNSGLSRSYGSVSWCGGW